MIDPDSVGVLGEELRRCVESDREILDALRAEVRPLASSVRRIQPRSTTAISLVGTDGGNNKIEFDPFMVQLVRVVDSSNNEYCLEAITPTSDMRELNSRHFDKTGSGITALGRLMNYLEVEELWKLSHMIPAPAKDRLDPVKPSWVQVYREITEWAILFSLVRDTPFGSDTVIIADGNLRSKVFAKDLFIRFREGLDQSIQDQFAKKRRRIHIAGVSKHSKVLQRYRLAMALEGVLRKPYPCFVEVPREIEAKAYVWQEYARGDEGLSAGGELNKFVAGKMFLVKFGAREGDPIWPVDILISQVDQAQTILGYMLADAECGFPVPFYPQCLQRAHENAALVDFDMDILQQQVIHSIRNGLGEDRTILDLLQFAESDPASRRYS